MKIIGLTRVRNEAAIIKDTLDYYAPYCNLGILVFDDASEDETVKICSDHPAVNEVFENKEWKPNRTEEEYKNRQTLLEMAQKYNADWIIYFDADERIDFSFWDQMYWAPYDAIMMKLFDFYITESDVDKDYKHREFCGSEYREIVMMFKNNPALKYHIPDQRVVTLAPNAKILKAGYVKHYGKAISIAEWEETCKYYYDNFPEPYKTKWKNRMGKAVHKDVSDFGLPLIRWSEKETKGVLLTPLIEKQYAEKN